MATICYRDWVVMPGEDLVFTLSGLFRAHHGLIRAQEIPLVLVPFHLNDIGKPTLLDRGGSPQGLRAYFMEADEDRYVSDIRLSPVLEDSLKAKSVRIVDERRVAGEVTVKRLRLKSDAANLRRFIRRNPDIPADGKMRHWAHSRTSRPGKHLWLLRDQGRTKIPFFFRTTVTKVEMGAAAPRLEQANSYGMGCAPLIDFFV